MKLVENSKVGIPFNVWVVFEGDDDRSKGHPNTHLVFTDEVAAKEEAMNVGYYGGNAPVEKFLAIQDEENDYWLLDRQISDIDKTRHVY